MTDHEDAPRWAPEVDYEPGDVVLSPVKVRPTLLGRLLGRRARWELRPFICTSPRRGDECWRAVA